MLLHTPSTAHHHDDRVKKGQEDLIKTVDDGDNPWVVEIWNLGLLWISQSLISKRMTKPEAQETEYTDNGKMIYDNWILIHQRSPESQTVNSAAIIPNGQNWVNNGQRSIVASLSHPTRERWILSPNQSYKFPYFWLSIFSMPTAPNLQSSPFLTLKFSNYLTAFESIVAIDNSGLFPWYSKLWIIKLGFLHLCPQNINTARVHFKDHIELFYMGTLCFGV